ncbi:MAG: hypothetical protein ACFB2X_08035 [Rivularia sp. (in: cyanobacteria)]
MRVSSNAFEDLSITQQGDNTLIATSGSDLAILQDISAQSLVVDNEGDRFRGSREQGID